MTHFQCVAVQDSSAVAVARRAGAQLGFEAGLDETTTGKLSIVITELATNLVKHGGGGHVLLRIAPDTAAGGLEILALDKGPGMQDVQACMRDGYSTSGSPGTGLGAIQRLSSSYQIWSRPGQGTAALSRILPRGREFDRQPGIRCAGVNVPVRGEELSGDNWSWRQAGLATLIVTADGLGHGPLAHRASSAAVEAAAANGLERNLTDLMERMHAALRPTRGAAVALTLIDAGAGVVRFVGVGNIAGVILEPGDVRSRKQLVSHAGTVGHELRKVQEFTYPWTRSSMLVLHSDGIVTHWNLEGYPGLLEQDSAMIAGVMYRDFNRGRDDATVVVARGVGV